LPKPAIWQPRLALGGAQPSEETGPLSLALAPDPVFGWSSQAYTYAWSMQLGALFSNTSSTAKSCSPLQRCQHQRKYFRSCGRGCATDGRRNLTLRCELLIPPRHAPLLFRFLFRSFNDRLSIFAGRAANSGGVCNSEWPRLCCASQTAPGGFITDLLAIGRNEQRTQVDAIFTAAQSFTRCRSVLIGERARNSGTRGEIFDGAAKDARCWSYYGQGTDIVISPDVDDTSVSWRRCNVSSKDSPAALDAVRASRNERGLLRPGSAIHPAGSISTARNIDTVVNLNALLLFGLVHEKIDSVCKFEIEQVESADSSRHRLLFVALMFAHAFSRAYREGDVTCCKARSRNPRGCVSMQNKDGSWGNDLETHSARDALNLGYHGEALERAIKAILAANSSDAVGRWAAYRAQSRL